MAIPNKIRLWRKHRDMTLEDLGSAASLDPSTISLYERGLSDFSGDALGKLAVALNCTTGNLLDDDPTDSVAEITTAARGLSPEQRGQLVGFLKAMLGESA